MEERAVKSTGLLLSWAAFWALGGAMLFARADTPAVLPERYVEVVLAVDGMV